MDKDIFVKNVKMLCLQKGLKPTIACRESGVGNSFLSDIQSRGSVPSVAKVQMLAEYLGVTTSELLGETDRTGPGDEKKPTVQDDGLTQAERDLIALFRRLTPEQQDFVIGSVRAAADKL